MTKIAQIIVAAGKSARFMGNLPKQYEKLGGKTVLRQTLENLHSACPTTRVFVIVHADGDNHVHSAIEGFSGTIITVPGGTNRSLSVKAGMATLEDLSPDIVLIHDAARPFVSQKVVQDLLKQLETHDAAVPVLPVIDAVKSYDGAALGEDLSRAEMRRVQTPQAFRFNAIWPLFQALRPEADYPDDIALASEAGLSIATVEGDERSFKITYPGDLKKAKTMFEPKYYTATGTGFDVHRIEAGPALWLCGVKIEAGFALKGHSDADVGLHALTDAIFGAIAEGDIGDHFPPSDPKWKGAESHIFLTHAKDRVKNRGGVIQNIDVTLICEEPKIKPHREKMRHRISELLAVNLNRVSVKATTTEKLGFTGRGEGIAAQATATVSLPDE